MDAQNWLDGFTEEEIKGLSKTIDEWTTKKHEQKQIEVWWKGVWGRKYCYSPSNIIDPNTRVDGWKILVGELPIKRILEVGCNRGHNLTALSKIGNYDLYGIEPYNLALDKAKETNCPATLVEGNAFDIPFPDSYFDLVFTCAVLMHIESKYLPKAISEIIRVSKKYILTIEYYSESVAFEFTVKNCGIESISFRDYTNSFPNLLEHGKMRNDPRFEDFDKTGKLAYWLFEK